MTSESDRIALPHGLVVKFSVETRVTGDSKFLDLWVISGLFEVVARFDIVIAVTASIVALDD